MNKPTHEQIAKLPKWAREHIETLERDRDSAHRVLKQFTDKQLVSPFFYEEAVYNRAEYSGPKFVRRYIDTHRVSIKHQDVLVEIVLPNGVQGREGIEVNWRYVGHERGNGVGLFPTASNMLSIAACRVKSKPEAT